MHLLFFFFNQITIYVGAKLILINYYDHIFTFVRLACLSDNQFHNNFYGCKRTRVLQTLFSEYAQQNATELNITINIINYHYSNYWFYLVSSCAIFEIFQMTSPTLSCTAGPITFAHLFKNKNKKQRYCTSFSYPGKVNICVRSKVKSVQHLSRLENGQLVRRAIDNQFYLSRCIIWHV